MGVPGVSGVIPQTEFLSRGSGGVVKAIHGCSACSPTQLTRSLLCAGALNGEGQVALVQARRSVAPLLSRKHMVFGRAPTSEKLQPNFCEVRPQLLRSLAKLLRSLPKLLRSRGRLLYRFASHPLGVANPATGCRQPIFLSHNKENCPQDCLAYCSCACCCLSIYVTAHKAILETI